MSREILSSKFRGSSSTAERYAQEASDAKRYFKSSCVVDGQSWEVNDIKNALLDSGNGELVRRYSL